MKIKQKEFFFNKKFHFLRKFTRAWNDEEEA